MSGAHGATQPRRYRAALGRLESAQKPGYSDPAYLRWVNRPLGRRAAAAAFVLGLRPNTVTMISGVLSLAALVLIVAVPATLTFTSTAATLLLLGYVLDSADGQLARLMRSSSVAGEWLDHVVDAARLPLFHLAIAVHFFRTGQPLWMVGAAAGYLILSSLWFFAQTLADKLGPSVATPRIKPPWVSWAKTPYDVGTLYIAVFTLSVPWVFAPIYLALFVITLAVAAVSLRRKYHSLAGGSPGKRAASAAASASASASGRTAPTPLLE